MSIFEKISSTIHKYLFHPIGLREFLANSEIIMVFMAIGIFVGVVWTTIISRNDKNLPKFAPVIGGTLFGSFLGILFLVIFPILPWIIVVLTFAATIQWLTKLGIGRLNKTTKNQNNANPNL